LNSLSKLEQKDEADFCRDVGRTGPGDYEQLFGFSIRGQIPDLLASYDTNTPNPEPRTKKGQPEGCPIPMMSR
jgi:hypothetical protein